MSTFCPGCSKRNVSVWIEARIQNIPFWCLSWCLSWLPRSRARGSVVCQQLGGRRRGRGSVSVKEASLVGTRHRRENTNNEHTKDGTFARVCCHRHRPCWGMVEMCVTRMRRWRHKGGGEGGGNRPDDS